MAWRVLAVPILVLLLTLTRAKVNVVSNPQTGKSVRFLLQPLTLNWVLHTSHAESVMSVTPENRSFEQSKAFVLRQSQPLRSRDHTSDSEREIPLSDYELILEGDVNLVLKRWNMNNQREQFQSNIGFILATAGSAVGIGNLVGFPVNAAKSGGGAFFLIYAFFIVLICLPVMMAEMALGRHSNRNPLSAYTVVSGQSARWRLVGWLAVITPFMIAVFYQVVTVWLLGYFIAIASGNLELVANPEYFDTFINSPFVFGYLLLLTCVVGGVLFLGVQNGIERLSKVLMPALIVMLLMLTMFVLTLPNASIGLRYFLVPDFAKINIETISLALSQAFFSLSLGMGILITYGSYLDRQQSIATGAKTVAGVDTAVAFIAGLLVIPAIFVVKPDIGTDELSSSSVSLVFSFLPNIFLYMETFTGYIGASIFAGLFFLLVFIAALTSQISILQVPLSALQDELKLSRARSLLILGTACTVLVCASTASFGMLPFFTEFVVYAGQSKSLFDVIVDVFYETILPLNGFLICIFIVHRWRRDQFESEMSTGDSQFYGSKLHRYVTFSLTKVIPLVLLCIFLSTVMIKFFA